MKILKLLSIFGIFLGLSLIAFSLYFTFLPLKETSPSTTQSQSNKITEPESTQQEEPVIEDVKQEELKESGWIPNWSFDTGITSVRKNIKILDEINPVLYSINNDGTLSKRTVLSTSIKELNSLAKDNDIQVIPTVGSYDYTSTTAMFKNSSIYKNNISSIIGEIEKYDFDGIDLDFEQIKSEYRDTFIQYLQELKNELSKKNKILSVTVFAQWDNAEYKTNSETVKVQDLAQIGQIADRVKVMAYDYTEFTSSKPGPIAPIDWIEKVLKYSTARIEKEKIYLGVHLYGYEWVGEKTEALTYTSVKNILDTLSIKNAYNEDVAEGYAKFSCEKGKETCEMYFQTKEGISKRKELANKYEIKGISYWRLGGELDILH